MIATGRFEEDAEGVFWINSFFLAHAVNAGNFAATNFQETINVLCTLFLVAQ